MQDARKTVLTLQMFSAILLNDLMRHTHLVGVLGAPETTDEERSRDEGLRIVSTV